MSDLEDDIALFCKNFGHTMFWAREDEEERKELTRYNKKIMLKSEITASDGVRSEIRWILAGESLARFAGLIDLPRAPYT